ncbi:MAG: hypothetical protein Q3M24_06765 [Candidatus Electrothrix aestuarii]|uniref:Uncharacterized protein n=1 Tax=Candidatus Electrothrix aestuarii TaxID=3062594 RepID=A0AAU8LZY0_9BACT|nr:hypothetical protein [Candidatus Electrothrix aestuarii]
MENNHPAWFFDESKQIGVNYTDNAVATEYDNQHESFRDFKKEALPARPYITCLTSGNKSPCADSLIFSNPVESSFGRMLSLTLPLKPMKNKTKTSTWRFCRCALKESSCLLEVTK